VGLYLRADSLYWWAFLDGTTRRVSTGVLHANDSEDAALRRQQKQLAQGVFISKMNELVRETHDLPSKDKTPRQTFRTFSEWYEKHVTARKRGKVREVYILTQLRKRLGPRELAAISQATVKEYLTSRVVDDEVSPNTANREVDLLKSMLREAVQARLLKVSPLVGMKRLRHVAPRKRVLTQAEEDRLLAALRPADRALYVVAVDTLMRLSNVLNLKRRDDKGTYLELTDSKTGPYTVPLSARARKALDSVKSRHEYFFWHRRQAKTDRDRRGAIRQMLKRACKRVKPKIPYGRASAGITFHTATRATGATRMLQAGVDARSVQAIGNWASFEQMGEYLQTDAKRMRQAVNTIGAGSNVQLTSPRTAKREARQLRAKTA